MVHFGPAYRTPPTGGEAPERPRILVVDDDASERAMYTRMLEVAGCYVESASDGFEALSMLELGFDLISLDADMPRMDGFEVAKRIRASPKYRFLPMIMVTGLPGRAEQRRAIELGINDFVVKPVDPDLFELRCRWLVDLDRVRRRGDRGSQAPTDALRRALEKASDAERAAHEAHLDTLRRLTVAAEYKDPNAAAHIERVGHMSKALTKALGFAPSDAEQFQHAVGLHDIGKLCLPDSLILETGPLDADDWEVMRSHTRLGAELLSGSPSPLLQLGASIAMYHHEAWNGTGYPEGLRAEEIPLEARVCAVVDVFDSVTMDRPHRAAFPKDEAFGMMACSAGERFDPEILEAFLDIRSEIEEIHATVDEWVAAAP